MVYIDISTIQQQDEVSLNQKQWFQDWISEEAYPCVMAKAVVKAENLIVNDYKSISNEKALAKFSWDLKAFIEQSNQLEDNKFASFIAVFSKEEITNELLFEKNLWKLLHQLVDIDPEPWDASVSSDPTDYNYSFSHQGTAFYIVGMHANSSRKARQTPYFTLVFNRHSQFEDLRKMGAFDSVRTRIRQRDKKFAGSVNPMLADFGEGSVAGQYSGRNIKHDISQCPFHQKQELLS